MKAIDCIRKGAKAFGQQQFDEAEKCFSEALSIEPQNHEALYNLGTILFIKQQHLEALKLYRRALEAKPGYVAAGLGVAKLYLTDGNPQKALAELQDLNRANDGGLNQHPEFCKLLGVIHAAQGDYDAAENFFRKYMLAAPESIDPWECIARTYRDREQDEGAIEVLKEALKRFTDHPQLLVDLVQFHAEQPFTEQWTWIEKLLDAVQPNPGLYEFCAQACLARKKYANGVLVFQRAKKELPDLALAEWPALQKFEALA